MLSYIYKGAMTYVRGVSFIEVLVGAALISIIFTGIFSSFQFSLLLVGNARASAGALALANERTEVMKALPYDSIGTFGGIPAGGIAQTETVTLNGIPYTRRTLVQYVDDPSDGSGAADTNGISADYKSAKVEVSWTLKGETRSLALITNLVPANIETVAGGGTLVVNVFDSTAAPVDGAEVRVVNASTSPAIDVTAYTNISGTVMFPGAPAAGGYRVTASKTGYSTDQTYSASSSNPNPNPPHVSVVVSLVSTVNFAIDETSTLVLKTVEPPSDAYTEDVFADASMVAAATSSVVASGDLALEGAPGTYAASGSSLSTSIAPVSLVAWDELSWTDLVTAQTSAVYRVYEVSSGGGYSLLPDSALPGNAAGFTSGPVDLSGISATTTPRLAVGIDLSTLDPLLTPLVRDWRVSYTVTDVPVPSIDVTLSGAKNIGTDGGGQPVLKYSRTHATNGSGVVSVSGLEWDQYAVSVNGASEGYDISDVCLPSSLQVEPDSVSTTTLVLMPHTGNSLLVQVRSTTGAVIADATVELTDGGFNETAETSACGYAFFDGLSSSSTYTLDTSATGYLDDTVTNLNISGTTQVVVTLADS